MYNSNKKTSKIAVVIITESVKHICILCKSTIHLRVCEKAYVLLMS